MAILNNFKKHIGLDPTFLGIHFSKKGSKVQQTTSVFYSYLLIKRFTIVHIDILKQNKTALAKLDATYFINIITFHCFKQESISFKIIHLFQTRDQSNLDFHHHLGSLQQHFLWNSVSEQPPVYGKFSWKLSCSSIFSKADPAKIYLRF